MIDKKLLDILACPICKRKLIENNDKLICENCSKQYSIIDNIPVLINSAEQATADSKEK